MVTGVQSSYVFVWTLLLLAAGYVLLGTLVALLYSFLWYVVMACVCSAAPFVVYYVVFVHRFDRGVVKKTE